MASDHYPSSDDIADRLTWLKFRNWKGKQDKDGYYVVTYTTDLAVAANAQKAEENKVNNFKTLTDQAAVVEEIAQSLRNSGLNIRLVKAQKPEDANLRIMRGAFADPKSEGIALGSPDSTSRVVDVVVSERFGKDQFAPGKDGRLALEHEICHGLGLNHPGPLGLGFSEDTPLRTNLMAYNGSGFMGMEKVSGLRLGDWKGLKKIYGLSKAAKNANSGDNTYTYEQLLTVLPMIHDTGGTDTLDLSKAKGMAIVEMTGDAGHTIFINDIPRNAMIHAGQVTPGTIIENIIAPRGMSSNTIKTGDENNRIIGGFGSDSIDGGGGRDIMSGRPPDGPKTPEERRALADGANADSFHFGPHSGMGDIVTDFRPGKDNLVIGNVDRIAISYVTDIPYEQQKGFELKLYTKDKVVSSIYLPGLVKEDATALAEGFRRFDPVDYVQPDILKLAKKREVDTLTEITGLKWNAAKNSSGELRYYIDAPGQTVDAVMKHLRTKAPFSDDFKESFAVENIDGKAAMVTTSEDSLGPLARAIYRQRDKIEREKAKKEGATPQGGAGQSSHMPHHDAQLGGLQPVRLPQLASNAPKRGSAAKQRNLPIHS